MRECLLLLAILSVCLSIVHPSIDVVTRSWPDAVRLAREFAAQLTLEEKCNMTAGVGGHCAGFVSPISRLDFGGLCFQDSPSGVGDHVQFSTAFAPGIQIAATWDRDLFYRRAAAIGLEFRGKGVHFVLGPMMNIDRNALHGRNWEGFGADPYLSGENSFYYVQGIQYQGVVATAKHYICNEQESNRTYYPKSGPSQGYSANVDDKTMHEIYLWPFMDSVVAGAGSVMCSYNQVNGSQACQNENTLNGLLKGELAFQGNVMSDWGATKVGFESALGGLDVEMPGNDHLMGYSLLQAVHNGSLPETRVTDMVVRIIAPYFLLGQDQGFPPIQFELRCDARSSLDQQRDRCCRNDLAEKREKCSAVRCQHGQVLLDLRFGSQSLQCWCRSSRSSRRGRCTVSGWRFRLRSTDVFPRSTHISSCTRT